MQSNKYWRLVCIIAIVINVFLVTTFVVDLLSLNSDVLFDFVCIVMGHVVISSLSVSSILWLLDVETYYCCYSRTYIYD